MRKIWRTLLALALALSMLGSVTTAFADAVAESETPLVVAYSAFSEKFSPFFADTAYDVDVATNMTQIGLLTTDRTGAVVGNAIEGETISYNGTDYTYHGPANITVNYDEASDKTTYTAKLREDLKFSDGEPVTADDVIFTYYVYCDPSYVGSTTISSYNIVGLQNYRTQTSEDVYAKYAALVTDISAKGIDHVWAEGDSFTQEQMDGYWTILKADWTKVCQAIVDYCVENYPGYIEDTMGMSADDVLASDGLKVAFGMAMWGFGGVEEGVFTSSNGDTWTLSEAQPTIDDYFAASYAKYAGDAVTFFTTETPDADAVPVATSARDAFIAEWGPKDEASAAGGYPNIEGIKKLDDYTVEITINGFEAPAIYNVMGIPVAPLHYYGDPAQYDYENNKFGFPYGDLSVVESKTSNPVGAGPYKFVKYENRVVYFEANELYFEGAPKTKYVQFKETNDNERAAAVGSGTVDMGELSGSKANFAEVAGYNANGETSGDVIVTENVDNLGYGYIGLNADTILVGDDPASAESKDLRKALATVFSVYRDVTYDSYYGTAASVINYPISNTSWAAPQPTDEDYKVAYSVDVEGNAIYDASMSIEDKYAAALNAAVGYLKAAGYTFDEATGKFTAAPEGASLSYEIIIPGDGLGDHPSIALLTDTQAALATIGIELRINDPADSDVLWDSLDAGTQNLWCAAWQSTIDPDMYQTYHSSGIVGRGGSDSNHYHVDDATLDQLLLDARKSPDQSYRKAVYKQCLDIICDWAVEIPCYQRQNSTIYSPQRIVAESFTPDITTFYPWMREIHNIEMAK